MCKTSLVFGGIHHVEPLENQKLGSSSGKNGSTTPYTLSKETLGEALWPLLEPRQDATAGISIIANDTKA
jgi:hypothetical protein